MLNNVIYSLYHCLLKFGFNWLNECQIKRKPMKTYQQDFDAAQDVHGPGESGA